MIDQGVLFAPRIETDAHEEAARLILRDLFRAGWRVTLEPPKPEDGEDPREFVRRTMAAVKADQLRREKGFLKRMEDGGVRTLLAESVSERPEPILQLCGMNEIEPVTGLPTSSVWRWMRLTHWTNTYYRPPGRSLLYLIRDAASPKMPVMGLLALSNCILNIGCRDEYIQWPSLERKEQVIGRELLEASTVGAIPPYGEIRAGKLAALLALSEDVRSDYRRRYGDELAYLGTTALYGVEPNQYTRARLSGGPAWRKVGKTIGYGTYSFAEDTVAALSRFSKFRRRWCEGASSQKRNILREGVSYILGDAAPYMRHAQSRITYGACLAKNSLEYLRGETNELDYYGWSADEIAEFWRERWARRMR